MTSYRSFRWSHKSSRIYV